MRYLIVFMLFIAIAIPVNVYNIPRKLDREIRCEIS